MVNFQKIDRNAIRGNWIGSDGTTATEVAGWHPDTNKILITGFESDGSSWQLDCPKVDKSGFSGHAIFREGDGAKQEGTFTLTLKSGDSAVTHFEGKDEKGESVTIDARFERVGSPSTPEEFHEFASLMSGRWSGDVTLIADWPGQNKKAGEKIIAYAHRNWASDQKAIVSSDNGGTACANELWHYDPVSKQIKISRIGSGGTRLEVTIWKETSEKWGWTTLGGLADGKKLTGTGHWVFKDQGKTAILQGDTTLAGKPLPKLKDVYTRLDQ